MLRKIDPPELNFDAFRLRQPGTTGFSQVVVGEVAQEVASLPEASPALRDAVGRICAGAELSADEHVIASWKLAGSRILRPLSLMHLRVEQLPSGYSTVHLGSVVLSETCETYGECADCIDRLQAQVVQELNVDALFGQGLMSGTKQVLDSIR
jgi:hypothetical protein